MGKVVPFQKPTSKPTDPNAEWREKFVEAGWFKDVDEVPDELIRFVADGFRMCYSAGKKNKKEELEILEQIAYLKGYEAGYIESESDSLKHTPKPPLSDFLKLVKVRLQEELISFAQDLDIQPRDAFSRYVVFYTEDEGWKLHVEVGEDEEYLRVDC